MKKKQIHRYLRFSLRTFLILVFGTAFVSAWLANANIEHQREAASLQRINKASVELNGGFEIQRKQDQQPEMLVLR